MSNVAQKHLENGSIIDQVTGTSYTGQVLRHGFGTEVDREGNKYEGQWHLNEKAG